MVVHQLKGFISQATKQFFTPNILSTYYTCNKMLSVEPMQHFSMCKTKLPFFSDSFQTNTEIMLALRVDKVVNICVICHLNKCCLSH